MAMTNSVPMSSDIAASARLANMIRAPLTQSRKPVSPIAERCRTFPVSGFAECEAQAAGFPEKPRKLEK
jgi:hypothetical protein